MVNRALKYYVYPYKQGSGSARALAQALGGKVLRLQGSRFRPGLRKIVINWGNKDCPLGCLNPAFDVTDVRDKLKTFQIFKDNEPNGGPRHPEWTTNKDTAQGWLNKSTVFVRNSLTGSKGSGIIVVQKQSTDMLPQAPLYVRNVRKVAEYRVHVFNNEVIDVQRKIRDSAREPTSWYVRSHDNGFIFVRNAPDSRTYKDTVSQDVKDQCLKAMACTGLLFGAVDCIVDKNGLAYVLEINSAPGLEGNTIQVYANAIRKHCEHEQRPALP